MFFIQTLLNKVATKAIMRYMIICAETVGEHIPLIIDMSLIMHVIDIEFFCSKNVISMPLNKYILRKYFQISFKYFLEVLFNFAFFLITALKII